MTHPSPLALDLAALEGRALEHVEDCVVCRERMRLAEADRAYFVANVLPRQLPTRRRSMLWIAAPVLAAAAAFVLLKPRPEPALGIKGGPTLQIYARHGEQVTQLQDGMPLAPGDAIRFVLRGAAKQHVLIASIDAAGVATVYYPFGGTTSARVDEPVLEVPGSVILDGTRGPERVYALFSRAPIEAAPILAALRAHGPEVPIKLVETQLSLRFEK